MTTPSTLFQQRQNFFGSAAILRARKQGRSQEFAMGTKEGVWGTEVPHRGPAAEPRLVSGDEAPEAGDMLNIRLNKVHKNSTQQK